MNILNLYYSQTGNTEKIAHRISSALKNSGHEITLIKAEKNLNIDLLNFDFIFAGSGVYQWLPGKPMLDFLRNQRKENSEKGNISMCSPRLPNKKAVIYCTYAGIHTGINEAVPAVKFRGQLFDHLGFSIVDKWYFPGEFKDENMKKLNFGGRFGNISGRTSDQDLKKIEEKVKTIIKI